MFTGQLVSYDEIKGYGFLAPDEGGEDVFLHVNDLTFDKRSLAVGSRVAYDLEDGDRGPKASNVRPADDVRPARTAPVAEAPATAQASPGTAAGPTSEQLATTVVFALLEKVPSLTGDQVLATRDVVLELAARHGWT